MLCLHCGKTYSFKRESYCEDCYQKLVADNLKLQVRVKELEEKLGCEHKPKHMKEDDFLETVRLRHIFQPWEETEKLS